MGLPAKKPTHGGPTVHRPGALSDAPRVTTVKKGELLFAEGETSKSMYFIKAGMLRIFKKKGNSHIEIATIHSGQVVGELAFLDGQPRSASAEALTDVQLVEVSGQTFTQTMAVIPDWLKILLKTIVGRLRSSSTRIRQLEQASTAVDYSADGKRSQHYVYLSPLDVMKIGTAILLVASRSGEKGATGIKLKDSALVRYGHFIMGIPESKITDFLDVLSQVGIAKVDPATNAAELIEIDFLEKFLIYANEENLKEPSKRQDVTLKGFIIMSMLVKYLSKYSPNPDTGITKVNVAEIVELEKQTTGKVPFRMEEFPELANVGLATNLEIKSSTEAYTMIKAEEFTKIYRFQRLVKAVQALNEKKSTK